MLPVGRGAFALASAVLLGSCADAYCQSGPRYGTQCYSSADWPSRAENSGTRPGDGALFRKGRQAGGKTTITPHKTPAPPPPSAAPSSGDGGVARSAPE